MLSDTFEQTKLVVCSRSTRNVQLRNYHVEYIKTKTIDVFHSAAASLRDKDNRCVYVSPSRVLHPCAWRRRYFKRFISVFRYRHSTQRLPCWRGSSPYNLDRHGLDFPMKTSSKTFRFLRSTITPRSFFHRAVRRSTNALRNQQTTRRADSSS